MEHLLIAVLIALIVFGALWVIIDLIPIDARFKLIAKIVVGAIALIWVLKLLVPLL